jgi:hypothetical protein
MSDDRSSGQDWESGDSGMDGGIDSEVSTGQSSGPASAPPPAGAFGIPTVPPIERLHSAYQRRHETDYIANFWSALGWGVLTVGIFYLYMYYRLIRRMRDHNARRLELLDAANAYAWEVAGQRGLQKELRPHFERTAGDVDDLRLLGTKLKDPIVWLAIYIVAFWFTSARVTPAPLISGSLAGIGIVWGMIVVFVVYCSLDRDLIKHDLAEGGVEAELAIIYTRLGQPLAQPDPARIKGKHNYVARIIVSIVTVGIYLAWWTYNMMNEPNRHFEINWVWEDSLADAVQALAAGPGGPGRQGTGGDRTAVGG